MRVVVLLLGFSLLSLPLSCLSANVRVAVATNFIAPLKQLSERYELLSGNRVILSSGSTGKLYAQIQQGAPYDVFLAADEKRPQLLEAQNAILANSRFTYARGQLALWSKGATMQKKALSDIYCETPAKFIAMANPKLAPYGRASIQSIESMSCKVPPNAQRVTGESIGQSYQYVATGAARIGFVAYSQVKNNISENEYRVIPQSFHQPIVQQGVVLQSANQPETALDFVGFLRSKEARQIIEDHGYLIDDSRS